MAHKFISATHNKKTLTAMYKMADGTIYIRKGGTIPWRLQNPGDVRPNKSNASEYLQPLRLAIADTASGQFSMFGSEEDGWETKKNCYEAACIATALSVIWQKYMHRKRMGMIRKDMRKRFWLKVAFLLR